MAAGRLLLIVIVMMLLLMQIDAEDNTEYRISVSSKPPQGNLTLRRLLFSLYVRKLGGLVSDTPVDHFFGGAAADGAGVGQVLLGEGDAAGGHAGFFLHL